MTEPSSPPPTREQTDASLRLLSARKGALGPLELSAQLRCSVRTADRILRELSRTHEASVSMDRESGQLRYVFVTPLSRRPRTDSLGERAKLALVALGRGLLQLGLGLVLLIYGALVLMVLLAFWGVNTQRHGSDLRREVRARGGIGRAMADFARRIQRFVLGGEVQGWLTAEDLDLIYGHLAAHGGVMTTADIMALTGRSYDEADRVLTWLMASDDAEVYVSDAGLLLYIFPAFRGSGAAEGPRWSWQTEPERWRRAGAGSPRADVLLLIAAAFVGSLVLEILSLRQGLLGGVTRILLADIPLAVSGISLLIPGLRAALRRGDDGERLVRLLRIGIMESLHDRGQPFDIPLDLDALRGRYPGPTRQELLAGIEAAARSVQGAVARTASGGHAIDSPRLRGEWSLSIKARDRVRAGVAPPARPVLG